MVGICTPGIEFVGVVGLVMAKTFGQILKEFRIRKGWSGERLGEEAGLTQGLVSKYETGKREPKRETILKIAMALGIAPDELLLAAKFLPDGGLSGELIREPDPGLTSIIEFWENNPSKRRKIERMVDILADDDDIYDPTLEDRENSEFGKEE